MAAPLTESLREFSQRNPLRMHMPGHKGKQIALPELQSAAPLDFTELSETGNLFEEGGAIGEAEKLWANVFQMEHAFFLTCGSTLGIHTSMALTCLPGDTVLIDRGCHKSVFNAMALLDLKPVYLMRKWNAENAVYGEIPPETVESLLKKNPEIRTVLITSPTYYGICSDIRKIAEIVHRYGARLVVDAAHGAHLPFLGECDLKYADIVIVSAHKTLAAPGQSAVLLYNGFSEKEVMHAASLTGTTSPSYLFMAALDSVREYMEEKGKNAYLHTCEMTQQLRKQFPSLRSDDFTLDPARFAVLCEQGYHLAEELEKKGIFAEMADANHVVFILTDQDGEPEVERLRKALEELSGELGIKNGHGQVIAEMPQPVQETGIREAWFGKKESCVLLQAEGRIAAEIVAPYPPGIPVIAPGEEITKKALAYLQQVGYNVNVSLYILS